KYLQNQPTVFMQAFYGFCFLYLLYFFFIIVLRLSLSYKDRQEVKIAFLPANSHSSENIGFTFFA
ncbi:hypothetical protein, partial [Flavobacterium sp.]|uniref:hypothetical protein n=1 Tax=Flavobacterium sp. TaxID=239 RepID=UPI0037BE3648